MDQGKAETEDEHKAFYASNMFIYFFLFPIMLLGDCGDNAVLCWE